MSVINRGRAVIWGVETTEGDTYAAGLIVSQNHAMASEKSPVKDQEGHTVGQVIFDDRQEMDIEVDCESGATLPSVGDDVTIAGVACIVQDCSFRWQNEAIKRFQLKAVNFALLSEA